MISGFATATINIVKTNGQVFEGVKAQVQRSNVYIFTNKYLIEAGDTFIHLMSNGTQEEMKVVHAGFKEAMLNVPARYEVKVERENMPNPVPAGGIVNNFNMNGPNAKVAGQSFVDNSVNVTSTIDDHFAQLRDEVRRAELDEVARKTALATVDTLEQLAKTENPDEGLMQTLGNALSHIGSCASIVGLFFASL